MKRASLRASGALGLSGLVRDSSWRRRRLLILCYHGISLEDEHDWDPALYMAPEVFEQRLRFLRRGGYSVLPLAEGVERLYSDSLPERSVVITFDDGMHDFCTKAFPLLQKYEFPATVYLTTHYCENNLPVFELTCSYMLWKKRGSVVEGRGVPGFERSMDLRNLKGRREVVGALVGHAAAKRLSTKEKNQLAEGLAGFLGLDFTALRSQRCLHIMSPDEVTVLAQAGVDFQLHTHRHRCPSDRGLFEKEIRDNRNRIREMTGNSPVHFCYPDGKTRREFESWLQGLNVISATTGEPDLASLQSNSFLLPRLVDHSSLAPVEFLGWLAGISSFLPQRPRHDSGID